MIYIGTGSILTLDYYTISKTGAQGSQGVQGAQGSQGVQGVQGSQGGKDHRLACHLLCQYET